MACTLSPKMREREHPLFFTRPPSPLNLKTVHPPTTHFYFSYGDISTVGFKSSRFEFCRWARLGWAVGPYPVMKLLLTFISEVIVTCSKLALGQLIQIQVMDSVSDKILKIYIYIKSSSLWHHQLAKLEFNPSKCQYHKMVKHTQTIRHNLLINCLSVFDKFVKLVHKGLKMHFVLYI